MKADRLRGVPTCLFLLSFCLLLWILSSHASKASVWSVSAACSVWLAMILVVSRVVWLVWAACFHWALVSWCRESHRFVCSIATEWAFLAWVLSVDVVYVSILAPADWTVEVWSILVLFPLNCIQDAFESIVTRFPNLRVDVPIATDAVQIREVHLVCFLSLPAV